MSSSLVRIAALLSATQGLSGNSGTSSFAEAKHKLEVLYRDHQTTLYCGCSYETMRSINRKSCGYEPRTRSPRASRVEWEHVVPAEAFGHSFPAWREGNPNCVDSHGRPYAGRRCAAKVDPAFRRMEADMYNLYPAIGELNQARSNFSMAEIPGETRNYGACDFEIEDRKIEPRPEVQGDIARTYQYMDLAYPNRGIISRKNRPMFEAWSKMDPVDAWECERARRIATVQGNKNPVTEAACAAAGL